MGNKIGNFEYNQTFDVLNSLKPHPLCFQTKITHLFKGEFWKSDIIYKWVLIWNVIVWYWIDKEEMFVK